MLASGFSLCSKITPSVWSLVLYPTSLILGGKGDCPSGLMSRPLGAREAEQRERKLHIFQIKLNRVLHMSETVTAKVLAAIPAGDNDNMVL